VAVVDRRLAEAFDQTVEDGFAAHSMASIRSR
jgi:hypothetical protein